MREEREAADHQQQRHRAQPAEDVQRPGATVEDVRAGRDQKQRIDRKRDQEEADLGEDRTDHVANIR